MQCLLIGQIVRDEIDSILTNFRNRNRIFLFFSERARNDLFLS